MDTAYVNEVFESTISSGGLTYLRATDTRSLRGFPWVKTHGYDQASLCDEERLDEWLRSKKGFA